MESRSGTTPEPSARQFTCPECATGTITTAEHAGCPRCGATLIQEIFASTILKPQTSQMDRTLTAYLAAPLPEEVLRKAENPANVFGKYVFLREIGRGATGTVLKAWDTYLSRHVALKFLHSTASRTIELDDLQRVQDFLREARLAARLRHPNIVQIHDVDCRDNRYFIGMEFIGGGTLADRIHGPAESRVRTRFYLEPRRFLELLHTIALAVHHAHRQSPPVVHRDLKPQNVLLDAQDKPYVADFGLANEIHPGPQSGATGIRGTPAYMAPEQALGRSEEVDARTDVYSLGVILFEIVVGEAPFKGDNVPSVLRKVVSDPPETPSVVVDRLMRNSREVAACPKPFREALDRVCLKALAKEREKRYESALAFADALEDALRALGGTPATARSKPPPRQPRYKLLVSMLVVALALLPLSWMIGRSDPPPPAAVPEARPGDEPARLAAHALSMGAWSTLRSTVAEIRRRDPDHPRLPDFERQLSARDAELARRRSAWSVALDGFRKGGAFPADLDANLDACPEIREELKNELRRLLGSLESSVLEDARKIVTLGPGASWGSREVKARAAALSARATQVRTGLAALHDGQDEQPLSDAVAGLDAVVAYLGAWTLRINLTPYAEFRVVDGTAERARGFTPSLCRDLEIRTEAPTLELSWPSFGDRKLAWSSRLPSLTAGDTIVVSGTVEEPVLRIERR